MYKCTEFGLSADQLVFLLKKNLRFDRKNSCCVSGKPPVKDNPFKLRDKLSFWDEHSNVFAAVAIVSLVLTLLICLGYGILILSYK